MADEMMYNIVMEHGIETPPYNYVETKPLSAAVG